MSDREMSLRFRLGDWSQDIRVCDMGKRQRLSAEGEIMGYNEMSSTSRNKAEHSHLEREAFVIEALS